MAEEKQIVEELKFVARLNTGDRPVRLNELFDVGRARPNDHKYGQPLAVIPQEENIPIDTTRWGVVDFRPLVHDSIRFDIT